jgi:hypothetical protein
VSRRLSDVGWRVQSRIKRMFDHPLEPDAPPLEILRAVLDDVERRVQPAEQGRRVFPYDRVAVRVRQPHSGAPEIEAAFGSLETRIRARLAELRCEPPPRLSVSVEVIDERPDHWPGDRLYVLACERTKQPAAAATADGGAAPATRPSIQVEVVRGTASEAVYVFDETVISIGRTADPVDDLGRTRRNRVAFLDAVDGVTETVGRAHARLRFDPATGGYSVFDEGSRNGTTIVRRGDTIPVPARDPRGIRLQSGDELQVGRAVLRVTMGNADEH